MAKLIWSDKDSGQKQASHSLIKEREEQRLSRLAEITFQRDLAITAAVIIAVGAIAVLMVVVASYG